jgi:predicted DsbA family dithiol-disulfide isomerase
MQIDVWSDYACPWCALGLARLRVALGDFEHGADVAVVHRSFELHRGAPARSGGSMEEVVGRKYGLSTEQVRAGHAQLTALGAEVGFAFDFARVRLGSTFDAHRLTQAARGTEWEEGLARQLFAAHFSEGRQLSDVDVLREVARAVGFPDARTEEVLGGSAYGDEVRADEAAADELDVTGVPFFLINGAWPIPGAQDVETLSILLQRAWSRISH